MIRLFLWLGCVCMIYWISIDATSEIQKVGFVMGSTLLSVLPLMSIKWWCYADHKTTGRTWGITNHAIAPVIAILTPMIFINGLNHITIDMILMASATFILLYPSGQLAWFWSQRFGDLKSFPESGQLSVVQLNRMRNLAVGWVILPLPLYFIASLLWDK